MKFPDSLLILKFVRWMKLLLMCSGSLVYSSVANLEEIVGKIWWKNTLPCEAFLVNINFERINTCYKNINSKMSFKIFKWFIIHLVLPEVKLEVVDKKRILDIALNTQLRLLVWNLTNLVYHLDYQIIRFLFGLNSYKAW